MDGLSNFWFSNVKYNYCPIYLLVVFLSKAFDTKCLNMIIWVVLEWTCQLKLARFQLAKQTLFWNLSILLKNI